MLDAPQLLDEFVQEYTDLVTPFLSNKELRTDAYLNKINSVYERMDSILHFMFAGIEADGYTKEVIYQYWRTRDIIFNLNFKAIRTPASDYWE